MYKIKIEDDSGKLIADFDAEGFNHSEDRGISLARGKNGKYKEISSNGQYRVLIKGWRGCENYEQFVKES